MVPILGSGLGITRVGDLTGLDRIGLPVWASYRPNARSLSVCQGKGLSDERARLTATMEAIETALAESAERLRLIEASAEQMQAAGRRVVPFDLMMKCRLPQEAAKSHLRWVEGVSLATGKPIWAPYELVGLDWRDDGTWRHDLFKMTSVGLAAHFSAEWAILNGLLEAIEYDAVALAFSWAGIVDSAAEYDAGQCHNPGFMRALERVKKAGFEVCFVDITTDIGLPVVLCILEGASVTDDRKRAAPFAGHACRLDGEEAMLAALLEAVQTQATDISGARDDINRSDYALRQASGAETGERDFNTRYATLPRGSRLSALPVARQIEFIRSRLAACGIDDVYSFDLKGEDYGVACYRVLCPSLEIGTRRRGYRIGSRARRRIIQHTLSQR